MGNMRTSGVNCNCQHCSPVGQMQMEDEAEPPSTLFSRWQVPPLVQ